MKVEAEDQFNDNKIYYERNLKLQSFQLPPEHPALEVFNVDASHPCFPGKGLRVREAHSIRQGEELGHYAGIFRLTFLADTSPYSFEVNKDFVVDALHNGNKTRFVNDPRGIPSAKPNVGVEEVAFAKQKLYSIRFYALYDIAAGAELYLDYGTEYSMSMRMKVWEPEAIDIELIPVKKEPGLAPQACKRSRSISSLYDDYHSALREHFKDFLRMYVSDPSNLRYSSLPGKLEYVACEWDRFFHIYEEWSDEKWIHFMEFKKNILCIGFGNNWSIPQTRHGVGYFSASLESIMNAIK